MKACIRILIKFLFFTFHSKIYRERVICAFIDYRMMLGRRKNIKLNGVVKRGHPLINFQMMSLAHFMMALNYDCSLGNNSNGIRIPLYKVKIPKGITRTATIKSVNANDARK